MNDFNFNIQQRINDSIEVKQRLGESAESDISKTGLVLANAVKSGQKIMFCGNGGSAADSQHLAAELVIRFRSEVNRPAVNAIALTVDPSIMTAGGNDIGFENVFARSVEAYGNEGDILVGISTSGNSENVIRAVHQANKMGLISIGLLGGNGGKLAEHCNYTVIVPSNVTARIQESHILIGHIWCEMIEEFLFPDFIQQ